MSSSRVVDLINTFSSPCECGLSHETTVKDIRIGSGLVFEVGKILKENSFPEKLLVVADRNTLRAADGILESLDGFRVETVLFDNLRVADMIHVRLIEEKLRGREIGVLAIGTGSIHDPCRLAAARQKKQLCLFATAPSMDGFASYSSPIVEKGFKASYPAKSPEVIIGDTAILAAAPNRLKSAGFGDMVAKYVGLIDWKIASLLTGERYCDAVAALARKAVDELMAMADRVTERDEETAGKIFEALLLTGIGMSFMKNSRPASGSEHIVAHLIECRELQEGKLPNLHGEDVGVCTLETLKVYAKLAEKEKITAHREKVDWDDVYAFYGPMAEDVRKLNEPDTIADAVDPALLEKEWQLIREAINSVPSYDVCREAMEKAGCLTTVAAIGKTDKFFAECEAYSPYMRRRLTLFRLRGMID